MLFVSAYRDIGRDAWSARARGKGTYARFFEKLRASLLAAQLGLVLYIDPVQVSSMALNTTGVRVVPLSEVRNSIFERYVERERSIMASAAYRKRVPTQLLQKPEHSRAEYGGCFLRT